MKPFFKTTLAATLGVILASVITSVLSFIIISGLISASETPVKIQPNSLLEIKLTGILNEYQDPLAELSAGFSMSDEQLSIGLDEILNAISIAKNNDNIIGIYLNSGVMSSGIASLQEIRNALVDFKESGKFVYAYADEIFEQGTYYVCSIADKIIMNPSCMFGFYGMSSTPLFYTDVFKKVGIKPEIFKVGSYKSAVEPYTNTEMSAANREQVSSFLNNIWGNLLEDISVSRNLSAEDLQKQADKFLLLKSGKDVLATGLIDTLEYESAILPLIAKEQYRYSKDLKLVSVKALNNLPVVEKEYVPEKIAVLYAAGEIKSTPSYYGEAQEIVHRNMIKEIQKIQKDSRIKAVVFRVNSPGGSAFASEQICQAIRELKEVKPVVVSMGDYAASGGYYISCFADKIVTAPTTLTGSIGIFGMFFNAEELSRKIGLHYDMVKTNRYADFGNMLREMNQGEKALMQKHIENGYDLFVDRCANGRKMEDAQIRKIAEGRVWTGEQAVGIGLADELGYLDDAIEAATELAGVSKYRIVSFPEKKSIFTLLMENMNQDVQIKMAKKKYGESAYRLMELKELTLKTGVLARMPYMFDIQ